MAEEFQESDIVFNGNNYYIQSNEDCLNKKSEFEEEERPADHELLRRVLKRKKVDDNNVPNKPMSIPKMSNRLGNWRLHRYNNIDEPSLAFEYEDEDDDDEMLQVPPHVMIIRRRLAQKMAFSVCFGMGRTLKGRDLSQMRNSVLRMTGFLET